jgi:hypothetical protein
VEWEILMTAQVEEFLDDLYDADRLSHQLVIQAILVLEQNGPAEGRPLVDTVTASRVANMKELRPPSAGRSDPWRSAVLLVAGDKSGQWTQWYRTAIPQAEQITLRSGRRRWAGERGIAVAGVTESGARCADGRGTGSVRGRGVCDAG